MTLAHGTTTTTKANTNKHYPPKHHDTTLASNPQQQHPQPSHPQRTSAMRYRTSSATHISQNNDTGLNATQDDVLDATRGLSPETPHESGPRWVARRRSKQSAITTTR